MPDFKAEDFERVLEMAEPWSAFPNFAVIKEALRLASTSSATAEQLAAALGEIAEAADKFYVLGLNHPGAPESDQRLGARHLREDKAFMLELAERFRAFLRDTEQKAEGERDV